MQNNRNFLSLKDYGDNPFIFNSNQLAMQNNNFRVALWTGEFLQLTLMSITVGSEIGLEIHSNLDQFISIVSGLGFVQMGSSKTTFEYQERVSGGYSFIIPAGTYHNLKNIGNAPLKLYSIYAPPQHPFGTIHKTKNDADH